MPIFIEIAITGHEIFGVVGHEKMHFLTNAACRTAQTGSRSSFVVRPVMHLVDVCVEAEHRRDRSKNEFLANFNRWRFSIGLRHFSHSRSML